MADHEPFLEIGDLLGRLHRLRDWARKSGPHDVYIDLLEACAICEALENPDHPANKTVDIDTVVASLRRRGIHVVPAAIRDPTS
jgi:hypothetical protein